MTKRTPPTESASVDDAKLAELRSLGREALDRWQRIAADDPDAETWAHQIAVTIDAEALQVLLAEYRRLARDARLDPGDRAEARLRAKALEAIQVKRPGKKK